VPPVLRVATDHGAGARRVTLLTDFGTADGYVAAMKGAIADIAPSVIIDDASHDIPPGDIAAAAWALAGYWDVYPAGTIHVVVVDPGVGTHRNALAIRIDGRFLVGPDNGVFTHVLASGTAVGCGETDGPAYARDVGLRNVPWPRHLCACRSAPGQRRPAPRTRSAAGDATCFAWLSMPRGGRADKFTARGACGSIRQSHHEHSRGVDRLLAQA
jgi:hypothetical protein